MKNNEINEFYRARKLRIEGYETEMPRYQSTMIDLTRLDYEYNFDMLGRPIIQMPQDIVAIQEIIWKIKPDLIIETGIAHGGSLILSAAMLSLLEYEDAVINGSMLDPNAPKRRVIGIDIDIREHNKKAIEEHPMSSRIQMIQGSSTDSNIVEKIKLIAKNYNRIMVCLDSNHTHDHVLAELKAYAPLVSIGSYCVVFDSNIEDIPKEIIINRPWGPSNNPKTAILEYLSSHSEFKIDKEIQHKLLITVAPEGYLLRIG
jgi:cephalosporin hydroxylase